MSETIGYNKLRLRFSAQRKWDTRASGRECGTCTACCTWLGIEELRKYTGEKCKHLRGPAYGTRRCGIYPGRPKACSGYTCAWREGWGPAALQPKDSGILITLYDSSRGPVGTAGATVTVFDKVKADPLINDVISELIMCYPIMDEVRLIFVAEKKALLLRDGNVYKCHVMPSKGFEDLTFAAEDPPIGRYSLTTQEEAAPASDTQL